jgi:hypothetical protein
MVGNFDFIHHLKGFAITGKTTSRQTRPCTALCKLVVRARLREPHVGLLLITVLYDRASNVEVSSTDRD